MVKERYNPLDYFHMGIIEEIFCRNDAKIENQDACNTNKQRLKSTKTLTENFKALCGFVFRSVFRTQLKIHDGAF